MFLIQMEFTIFVDICRSYKIILRRSSHLQAANGPLNKLVNYHISQTHLYIIWVEENDYK